MNIESAKSEYIEQAELEKDLREEFKTDRLRAFDKFYELNKHQILPDEKIEYGLNKDNINRWLEDQLKFTEDVEKKYGSKLYSNAFKDISIAIATNMRYISFKEFYGKLKLMAIEIKDICKQYKRNILYIGYCHNMNKSNLWIGLLIYTFIKDILNDIIGFDVIEMKNNAHIIKSYHSMNEEEYDNIKKNTAVIHVDDMSYSGSQINSSIQSPQNFAKWIIAVPYISDIAIKFINDNNNNRLNKYVIFLQSKDIIYSLKHIIENSNDKKIYNIYHTTVLSSMIKIDNIIPVYFYHKLADYISVPTFIIAFGNPISPTNVDDDKQLETGRGFINNCNDMLDKCIIEKKISNKRIQEVFIAEVSDFCVFQCPPPIYKTIKYIV